METGRLEELRLLLLGDKGDQSRDDLIQLLWQMAESRLGLVLRRLRSYYGLPVTPDVPMDLNWIVTEVVVKRFNRIGSEGFASEAVDGHSISFASNVFDEYMTELEHYLSPDPSGGRSGRVVIY